MLEKVTEPPAGSITVEQYALQYNYNLSESELKRIKVMTKFWLYENRKERPILISTPVKGENGIASYDNKYYYPEHMQIALTETFKKYSQKLQKPREK